MMKIQLFVFCTSLLLFYSCDRARDTKQYISRIDSLSHALEESASDFEIIDTAFIHKKFHLIDEQLEMILIDSNNYDQVVVNKYNYIRKTFFDVFSVYPEIINDLEYTRSQLSNLRYDINNKFLNHEKAQLYFCQEKQSVKVLKLKMDFYQEQFNSGLLQYEKIYPETEKMIDSLKQ